MKTVIRLQNHGCRNHPLWWIVVMGQKRNIKGRFLEHVGYWLPRKTQGGQRSIILNKPRLRYWLAMGADPSPKVGLFLSLVDMMPTPVIKYGKNTLYDNTNKWEAKWSKIQELKHQDPYRPMQKAGYYEYMRKKEEDNLILKKMMAHKELEKQVDIENDKKKDEVLDLDERTAEFYRLQDELYQYEKAYKNMPSSKREYIIQAINKLAEQGINSDDLCKFKGVNPSETGKLPESKQQMENLFKLGEKIEKKTETIQEKIRIKDKATLDNIVKESDLIKWETEDPSKIPEEAWKIHLKNEQKIKRLGSNESPGSFLHEYKMKTIDMSKRIAKDQMEFSKFLLESELKKEKFERDLANMKYATEEEIRAHYLKTRPDLSLDDVTKVTRRLLHLFRENGGVEPTKQDILEMNDPPEIFNMNQVFPKKLNNQEFLKNIYIPTPSTVHPFPDISRYDPDDYYDSGASAEQKLNHNKPYQLPNIDDLKLEKRQFNLNRSKDKKLRSRMVKWKVKFSTVKENFLQSNISFNSFILLKIEEISK